MMKLVNCYHVRKRRRRRQPTSWPGKDAAVPHQIGPSSQALLNQSHAQCGAAPAQSDELLSHPRLRQEVDARHTVRCAQEVPPSDPMDNQASSLTSTATPVLQLQRQRHRFTRKIFNRQLLYLTLLCLVLANEDEIQRQLHKLKMPEAPDPASTRSNSGSLFLGAQAHQDANRLYEDLMMTYNRIVRPVQNESDKVVVRLGLKLSQLMDVNLKNQMMTINVWLNQEWSDYKLKWDPSEYNGIEEINLPAEQIWLPDIVLYNSAEGYFAVSIMTKAKVRYDGYVIWNPPAIFRSSCQIDITYFPFDSQNCHLKFGSWTFGTKIDLRHLNDTGGRIEEGTDLSEYYQNVEWDIMHADALKNVMAYECCPHDLYTDVTFHFRLRRKPLFYTVNLILPCVGITFFSFLVFYLPSDSGEKVTLTISILVSLIFFLSVLIETIPSTSLAMPLLGKYLVFTMILVTLSVCATVCVLNIHFRTPSTHSMPPWVKRWCMDILPKYLFMSVPQYQSSQANILPEQLIYLHNQAYASQAVSMPPLLATQPTVNQQQAHRPSKQNQQLNPATLLPHQNATNLGCRSPARHVATALMNGLQGVQGGPMLSGNESLIKKQPQQPMSGLNVGAINQLQHTRSFLPYLQSEAARRLQMQRSRSSEYEKSTSDNNNQPPNVESRRATTSNTPDHWHQSASATPRQSRVEAPGMKQQVRTAQTLAKVPSQTQPKPFWRLFGRSSKSDEQQASQQEHSQQDGSSSRRSRQRSRSSSSSTSSSTYQWGPHDDDDYEHHRHFQARASICSNNLWRIGPTRRCSLAVPFGNYPTYYRPLAQLQQQRGSGCGSTGGVGGPMTVSAITGSACLPPIPAHYHTHGEDSSESSSHYPSGTAVGTLINASATQLLRPSQMFELAGGSGSAPNAGAGQAGPPMTSGGFIRVGAQYSHGCNAPPPRRPGTTTPSASPSSQQQQQQEMPTPPPPLPPEFNDTPLYSSRPAAGAAAHQPYGARLNHSQQQQREQQELLMMQSGSANSTSSATTTTQYQLRQAVPPMMQPIHRYLASMSEAKQQQPTMRQSSNRNVQYLALGQQSMRRSRSTMDQRLSSMPRDVSSSSPFVPNQQQQIYRVYGSQQQQHKHQPQLEQSQSGATQPPHQSIGRQLGQAYIQRLQRQPTIYSLHHQLPNTRTLASEQSTTLTRPVGSSCHYLANLQQQAHYHEPSIDMLRRSKSQTSLNRRMRCLDPPASSSYRLENCRHCLTATQMPNGSNTISLAATAHQHHLCGNLASIDLRSQSETRGRLNSTSCRQATRYSPTKELASDGQAGNTMQHRQQQQQQSFAAHHQHHLQASARPQLREVPHECQMRANLSNCPQPAQAVNAVNARTMPLEMMAMGGQSGVQVNSNNNCENHFISNEELQQQRIDSSSAACRCSSSSKSALRQSFVATNAGATSATLTRTTTTANANGPAKGRQLSTLNMLKLIHEVDKAIQNAMFIAQHIDNLDEFESVKENWKYIAMVIDRIFLIVFLCICIAGTLAIFALVPWGQYLADEPIELKLRWQTLNLTSSGNFALDCPT